MINESLNVKVTRASFCITTGEKKLVLSGVLIEILWRMRSAIHRQIHWRDAGASPASYYFSLQCAMFDNA
jgi:hypothetical protein